MKKLIVCMAGLSLLFLTAGCGEQAASDPVAPEIVRPQGGTFGISKLGALAKRSAVPEIAEGPDVEFNLGSIRGSTGFYFLLYNIGATPITDVTLSIREYPFTVYPESMDSLVPGNDIGMLPIVKISAFHGTPYDGVGTRPMLPMGENRFTLLITGTTTTADGEEVTVTLNAEMSLEALVTDLEIESMYSTINLTNVIPSKREKFAHLQEMNDFSIPATSTRCTGDSVITILNTGNTPLQCMVYRSLECNGTSCNVRLETVEQVQVDGRFSYTITEANDEYLFILSGDNAVSNVKLQEDGKYYFSVTLGESECVDAEINERRLEYLAEREPVDCSYIWALIDNTVLFYAQSFNQGDSVYMEMYDLAEETVFVTYTGDRDGGEYDCRMEQSPYCDDMMTINGLLTSDTDPKILNGGINRISAGGARKWDESGL